MGVNRGIWRATPEDEKVPLTSQFTSAPGRTRTCDPLLRRQPLYPLSYRGLATFPPAFATSGRADSVGHVPASRPNGRGGRARPGLTWDERCQAGAEERIAY